MMRCRVIATGFDIIFELLGLAIIGVMIDRTVVESYELHEYTIRDISKCQMY